MCSPRMLTRPGARTIWLGFDPCFWVKVSMRSFHRFLSPFSLPSLAAVKWSSLPFSRGRRLGGVYLDQRGEYRDRKLGCHDYAMHVPALRMIAKFFSRIYRLKLPSPGLGPVPVTSSASIFQFLAATSATCIVLVSVTLERVALWNVWSPPYFRLSFTSYSSPSSVNPASRDFGLGRMVMYGVSYNLFGPKPDRSPCTLQSGVSSP